MNFNRNNRQWESFNSKYPTQMDAWLELNENKVLNEDYKFPDFPTQEELKLNTYVDRLKDLLLKINLNINELLKQENNTYDSFCYKYDSISIELSDFFYPLSHLKSVNDNKEIREVYSECLPLLSEHYSNIGQNEDLYNIIKDIHENETDPIRLKILNDSLLGFKLSGIGQSEEVQSKLKDISSKLSDLSNTFTNNILEAVSSYEKVVEAKDVEGMPEDMKSRALNKDGTYTFTLQIPSYLAYNKYGPNESVREELYKAYTTKASDTNEQVLEDILKLKNEKAKLLGYNNYSEISLSSKMVESSDKVIEFLTKLGDKSKPMGDLELKELNEFANTEVNSHSVSFYTNKLLKENYNFDEEVYKPYFESTNTVNGLFSILYKMFGLVFKQVNEAKVWDQRVTCYDVYKNNMKMSRIYLDLENRKGKNQGAWMNNWHSRYVNENGNVTLPIAFIVCNFTPALANKPSLLTPNEVVTLFHEMGHVLQHICYEGNELSCSGINGIEWDAVEWSSQFLESLVYNKDILNMFAKHYETGEIIPNQMVEKMVENKNFQSAWTVLGQTIYGLFDIQIHSSKDSINSTKVQETLNSIREKYSLIKTPDYNKFQCGFSHIFSGGYSAGYYSYKWAEVLSSDCNIRFTKDGMFNEDTCNSYYTNFLSKGSEQSSMDMFKAFMDREPNEDSLLEYLGIK